MRFGKLFKEMRLNNRMRTIDFIDCYKQLSGRRVSKAYISQVERGIDIPSSEFVYYAANIFNFDHEKMMKIAKFDKLDIALRRIEKRYENGSMKPKAKVNTHPDDIHEEDQYE